VSPRPAPDLTARRDRVVGDARRIAEAEGWDAVTIRRLATELGVTQPIIYTAFGKRQDIVDAVRSASAS
jgi:AcrR family transcriptional regulator